MWSAWSNTPFWDHEFEEIEFRWKHFLEEHEPEDAGLPPLGEGPKSHSPLFEPIEEIPCEFPLQYEDEDRPVTAETV